MAKVTDTYDLIIAGGGIPGLTLALLLGQAGLSVAVIDAEPYTPIHDLGDSSRTSALLENTINILRQTSVWEQAEAYAEPLKTMRIINKEGPHKDRPVHVDFHAEEIGQSSFGSNIENAKLRALLVQAGRAHKNITHYNPQKLETYEVDDFTVQAILDDGTTLTGHLIVGSDGRNSVVRSLTSIPVQEKHYDQSAITLLIAHDKSHNNISTEFHRSGGPFTMVPMQGNHSSIVWVEKTEDAQAYMTLNAQNMRETVQQLTDSRLGDITILDGPHCWPLMTLCAQQLIAPRVAIMAEAAHVLSPIGAQGLNLSLRDAATLAETIFDAARNGLDIGSLTSLTPYEKRRRIDIHSRVVSIDLFNHLVGNDNPILGKIRGLGLQAVNALPPVKQFVMQNAFNPAFDKGRAVSGLPL